MVHDLLLKRMQHINVFDIGARYGHHPTWKSVKDILRYIMVEADSREARRLQDRYSGYNNVHIVCRAVSSAENSLEINLLKNPAMSGSLPRIERSPLFLSRFSRENETCVVETLSVETTTIDQLSKVFGPPEFIKIDIEGSEPDALATLTDYRSVLGLRSEVTFASLYANSRPSTFSIIDEKMQALGFILLNLDYDGKGDYWSKYVSENQRYGTLVSTDAIWVRDPKVIHEEPCHERCAKYCIFLLLNNAPDVAIWTMQNFCQRHGCFPDSEIFSVLSRVLARHLYSIKWSPSQDIGEHRCLYESLFDKEYPAISVFNESPILNPP